MIYFVVRDLPGRYPMTMFLAGWGKRVARYMRVVDYEALFRATRLRAGSYVFSDLDYLDGNAVASAEDCWRSIQESGMAGRHMNHPRAVLRRYDLLRRLHEIGVNDFNVHNLDADRERIRFPVFLRAANDHEGPRTGLLSNADALDDAIRATGATVGNWMVTEFCQCQGDDGLYRKYGAFNVGGEIIPRHMIFSREWIVKSTSRELAARTLHEEREYIEHNPHAALLRDIFATARVDYGRIDYTVHNESIRVFEINTNPQIVTPGPSRDAARRPIKAGFARRFSAALEKCDSPAPRDMTVRVDLRFVPVRVRRITMLERTIRLTSAIGFARFEPQIFRRLYAVRLFLRMKKRRLWAHTPLPVRNAIRQLRHS